MYHIECKRNESIIVGKRIDKLFEFVGKFKLDGCKFDILNNVEVLLANGSHSFQFNTADKGAHSVGLSSCASLIIASIRNKQLHRGFVYHVNCGVICDNILDRALQALDEVDFTNCYVIYAHTLKQGQYDSELDKLKKHIPTDNIIEIYNVYLAMFGIQSNGVIGF